MITSKALLKEASEMRALGSMLVDRAMRLEQLLLTDVSTSVLPKGPSKKILMAVAKRNARIRIKCKKKGQQRLTDNPTKTDLTWQK